MAVQNFELCFQPGVIIKAEDGGSTLITGNTYSIIDPTSGIDPTTGITYCATLIGSAGPVSTSNYVGMLFDSCSSCLQSIPSTANTIGDSCVICDPCYSGGTATTVSVPHPVWTGLYGNSVTQGNAIQLGGQNGLYS